jgi:hypothetical protein
VPRIQTTHLAGRIRNLLMEQSDLALHHMFTCLVRVRGTSGLGGSSDQQALPAQYTSMEAGESVWLFTKSATAPKLLRCAAVATFADSAHVKLNADDAVPHASLPDGLTVADLKLKYPKAKSVTICSFVHITNAGPYLLTPPPACADRKAQIENT